MARFFNSWSGSATLCLLLLGILAFVSWRIVFFRSPQARDEMRRWMTQIELGDSRKTVRARWQAARFSHLELVTHFDKNQWLVRTPSEFGAGNWVLYLDFQNDSLHAARLRTADDSRFRPREAAPMDKLAR